MNTVALSIAALMALRAYAAPMESVTMIDAPVHGADTSKLPEAPGSLPADTKAFLQKYQPLSNAAAAAVGDASADDFVSTGLCYRTSPCFSIERVGTATIGAGQVVDQAHVAGLLDQLSAQSTVTIDTSHPNPVLYGSRFESNGLVLEVIAQPGTIPSNVIGGMVLDMYKAQVEGGTTNAVRAASARSGQQQDSPIALCLFANGADSTQTANFCLGKELDGSPVPTIRPRDFSLDSLFNGFCKAIDVPILC